MTSDKMWAWIHNWNTSCSETLGVDYEGNEITERTRFGMLAAGADVPLYINSPNDEGRKQVVAFLRMFADKLDQQ